MYCGLPVGRVTYMCEIIKVCIPHDDTYEDEEFFLDETDKEKEPKKGYAYLKQIAVAKPNNILAFDTLVTNGMKKNVQSPVRVTDTLLEYILSGFELIENYIKIAEERIEKETETNTNVRYVVLITIIKATTADA